MPQGLILGSWLFLICIHDTVLDTSICLLYVIVENLIQSSVVFNSGLSQVYVLASSWLVSFNPSKTESALFSRNLKKKQYTCPTYESAAN